jgi:glycerol uptake facilitator-like aquaporin
VQYLQRQLLAEFLGSAALLCVVVGSGVMGVNLAQGNAAIALLANALATAGVLYVLITTLGPISGAHFNPIVSGLMHWRGELSAKQLRAYLCAQVSGAVLGVIFAHGMFGLDLWQPGDHIRTGGAQYLSEAIATAGLVLTIFLGRLARPTQVPALVASYVFAAYWFTASTAFANPAVTFARALTQTFAGIRLVDVVEFIAAQAIGAVLGYVVAIRLLDSTENFH